MSGITYTVAIHHPTDGVTYEEMHVAHRDLADLIEALFSTDPGKNVLVENGSYHPQQTVAIKGWIA